jgi:hypothetical protein
MDRSLGWITESSYIHKPARPIQVDNASLVALRAALFQKEQELEQTQKQTKQTRASLLRLRKTLGSKQTSKSIDLEEDLETTRESLAKKAKLYDQFQREDYEYDSSDAEEQEKLVDFERKAWGIEEGLIREEDQFNQLDEILDSLDKEQEMNQEAEVDAIDVDSILEDPELFEMWEKLARIELDPLLLQRLLELNPSGSVLKGFGDQKGLTRVEKKQLQEISNEMRSAIRRYYEMIEKRNWLESERRRRVSESNEF